MNVPSAFNANVPLLGPTTGVVLTLSGSPFASKSFRSRSSTPPMVTSEPPLGIAYASSLATGAIFVSTTSSFAVASVPTLPTPSVAVTLTS